MQDRPTTNRRTFVTGVAGAAAFMSLGGATRVWAGTLTPTPSQGRGPFYPVAIPDDADSDLVKVDGRSERAGGIITQLAGRVVDVNGRPIAGSRVEIWQCDANGRYHHPRDRGAASRDRNFQGYGRVVAGSDGAYAFRTIKPVHYPGRTPHIHFQVSAPGMSSPLVTQMYVAGEPRNARDSLFSRAADASALLARFEPHPLHHGQLRTRFDIVLGHA